jgi:hypothetical protein
MAEFLCKTRLQEWLPGVWQCQEPARGKQKYQILVIPNIFILDINYWLLIIHVINAISLRPVFRPGRHLDPTSDWPGFISLGFRVSHISSRLSLHKLSSHTRLQTLILFTRYRTSYIAYSITCNEKMSQTQSSPTVIQWVIDTRPLWPSAVKTQDLTSSVSV